uniref:Major facilitator superfamily (MFS) profile domain-containing protein n=1 Tax=Craspedostauros australis TaxID=1486917 RepID=A0A7R9ZTC3_9STRA|mmetsp:Transcript_9614/g.26161  ORF Transcript_9614/g.26161 Transcript_9614/m.26161 type:complete len:301 (+) Transcript_9614:3-905(+)
MILGFWFVPESPRWLLTQGRHEEALVVLRHAADKNGKDGRTMFPDDVVITHDEEESTDDDSCLKLLSPKWFKLTMPLYSVWFGFGFLYYGGILLISLEFSDIQEVLQSSSADDSHGFDYNALFISGSAELFGLVVSTLIIDKLGRVATQFSAYFLGGAACLLLGCLSGSAPRTTTVALAFAVRFFMMSGSCSTWAATSELLPTDIRTTGHSAANAAGRMGGFAAPYLITPGIAPSSIGMLMMGIGLFTCFMSALLPETSGKALGEATTTVIVEDGRCEASGASEDLAKASDERDSSNAVR